MQSFTYPYLVNLQVNMKQNIENKIIIVIKPKKKCPPPYCQQQTASLQHLLLIEVLNFAKTLALAQQISRRRLALQA